MVSDRKALAFVRRLASLAILSLLAVSTTVQAAPGEGALSRDLREGRAAGQSTFRFIVQGSKATADGLAARYNARVVKLLKTGVVFEGTGEALDAMSADPAVGHLAGDTLVRSQMAVSTVAMGADQVWAGVLPGVPAATGRGIGVAVIDSGVSNHSALQGRVLTTVDFTGSNGAGDDPRRRRWSR